MDATFLVEPQMYGSGGRTSYNKAAQNTTNQELLLNLVRLRYSDTPYFLELNGITTQFNFSSRVAPSIKIPGFDEDNPVTIGGELGWSNQPTIQYSPLEGKNFAVHLMQPLDLRIIQGLIFTGWDVDRVFRLLIQHMADISNAHTASGPIPLKPPSYKKFFECLHLLRHFQAVGDLQVGIRYIPIDKKPISEHDACHERPNAIQISFPAKSEEAHRLANLLEGIKKSDGRYVLNMRQAYNENAEIGIMTRSLLSTMYYLSLGVQVPLRDVQAQTVAMTKTSMEPPLIGMKLSEISSKCIGAHSILKMHSSPFPIVAIGFTSMIAISIRREPLHYCNKSITCNQGNKKEKPLP